MVVPLDKVFYVDGILDCYDEESFELWNWDGVCHIGVVVYCSTH